MTLFATSDMRAEAGDEVRVRYSNIPAAFILWRDKNKALNTTKDKWLFWCKVNTIYAENDDVVIADSFEILKVEPTFRT